MWHSKAKFVVSYAPEHVVYVSEDRARAANHLPGAFAKTKKATNILRPAIDVSFLAIYEEFLARALSALKKKKK